eukprot:TRINITY_DN2097_c0_g1_i1.p1 TRINITY_DN2097_c0_g1~~TRINITY_DN2097_c0_g1_i1.p1  ORF type:complete len:108 (-),score=20.71 TRINITY_DN2097_c0_g1_i1:329-652(-)
MEGDTLLYEDKFVKIYKDRFEISTYYLPFGTARTVMMCDIISAKTNDELNLGILQMKGWGMGLSTIWWALDASRTQLNIMGARNTCIVLLVKDESTEKVVSFLYTDL